MTLFLQALEDINLSRIAQEIHTKCPSKADNLKQPSAAIAFEPPVLHSTKPTANWTNWSTATTAAPAAPSLQSGPTCSRHAIGLALQDWLNDQQFASDQTKIISTLLAVHNDDVARNPSEFDGKEIIVENQNVSIVGELKVKITVETALNNGLAFASLEQQQQLRADGDGGLVLRWHSQPCVLEGGRKRSPGYHAIYAKEYCPDTRTFSCVNSWGEKDPRPNVVDNLASVEMVDRIRFEKI